MIDFNSRTKLRTQLNFSSDCDMFKFAKLFFGLHRFLANCLMRLVLLIGVALAGSRLRSHVTDRAAKLISTVKQATLPERKLSHLRRFDDLPTSRSICSVDGQTRGLPPRDFRLIRREGGGMGKGRGREGGVAGDIGGGEERG